METEIKKIIEEFLKKTSFDFSDVSSDLDMSSGSFIISIKSNDSNLLIGKNGETIQSVNYLIKKILENKFKENTPKISIDINGYQKNRTEKIKNTAHMMSERARFFKSSIELPPMNSFERRIVHEYIGSQNDLKSESVGLGKDRHVVITFIKE